MSRKLFFVYNLLAACGAFVLGLTGFILAEKYPHLSTLKPTSETRLADKGDMCSTESANTAKANEKTFFVGCGGFF